MEPDRWSEALDAATAGMSPVGARERRRHARAFADWCRIRVLAPLEVTRAEVARHVADAAGGKPELASKIRCSLRAVMATIDPEHAARTLGLGHETEVLDNLDPAVARLAEATLALKPGRGRIRRSALRRLFLWAREVDAAPESLSAVDLPQFRAWLVVRQVHPGEVMVVARDFVELALTDTAASRRVVRRAGLDLAT